jgi:hypothetical protein
MNANMEFAGVKCPTVYGKVGRGEPEAITSEGVHLVEFLDAAKLLRDSEALTQVPFMTRIDIASLWCLTGVNGVPCNCTLTGPGVAQSDYYGLQKWAQEYGRFLRSSTTAVAQCAESSRRGVLYDTQLAAVSMFSGETVDMAVLAQQARLRLPVQIAEDGTLANEPAGAECEHNRLRALQAWSTLARQTQLFGVNLWAPDRRWGGRAALCVAAAKNIPFFSRNWQARPSRSRGRAVRSGVRV